MKRFEAMVIACVSFGICIGASLALTMNSEALGWGLVVAGLISGLVFSYMAKN